MVLVEHTRSTQAGRWYITARADCGSSSPHFLHGRYLGLESSGEPSNRRTDGTIGGVDDASVTAASINPPFNSSSDTATNVSSEGWETKQGGLEKDSGWGGLKVLSMQRDWAHMEWKTDALVPDGSENGADPETCPSVVDARDAIELRAAVVTQVKLRRTSPVKQQFYYYCLLVRIVRKALPEDWVILVEFHERCRRMGMYLKIFLRSYYSRVLEWNYSNMVDP